MCAPNSKKAGRFIGVTLIPAVIGMAAGSMVEKGTRESIVNFSAKRAEKKAAKSTK